jgi:predicted RNase H-like nuclease (RuvC/YqgF family)
LRPYLATGILSPSLIPSTEELLAMRYCAPHGELDATVGGLLAEMGMLHLAQACQNSLSGQEPIAGNTANQAVVAIKGSEKEVTVNEADDLTALRAQVQALDAEVKALAEQNFVTPNEVGKLAEKFKKTIGDLLDKVGSGAEKHDQLVQSVHTAIAEQQQQIDCLAKKIKMAADRNNQLDESIETLDAKNTAQQKQIGELAKKVEREGVKHGQLDKNINLAKDKITALENEQLAQRSKPMGGSPAKKAEDTATQSTPIRPSLRLQREQSLALPGPPSGDSTPRNSTISEKKRKQTTVKAEESPSPKRSATASRSVDSRAPPVPACIGRATESRYDP